MAGATPSPAQPPQPLRHRRDARHLTTGQLADFRKAISGAQAIHDDRGYQRWAGIHGLPLPISCTHHDELFLPWHRAYLYLFEKALQDVVPGVTLPWWDWTKKHAEGVPPIYAVKRPANKANPLFSSPIQASGREDPSVKATFRDEGVDGELPTPADLADVLAERDFFTFQTKLESLHDGVHVWTGGTMQSIATAAYDPVFWAHHAMIDRVWYLWQLQNHTPGVPAALHGRALAGLGMTVRDTLHPTTHLGYDYATSTVAAPGPPHHG